MKCRHKHRGDSVTANYPSIGDCLINFESHFVCTLTNAKAALSLFHFAFAHSGRLLPFLLTTFHRRFRYRLPIWFLFFFILSPTTNPLASHPLNSETFVLFPRKAYAPTGAYEEGGSLFTSLQPHFEWVSTRLSNSYSLHGRRLGPWFPWSVAALPAAADSSMYVKGRGWSLDCGSEKGVVASQLVDPQCVVRSRCSAEEFAKAHSYV